MPEIPNWLSWVLAVISLLGAPLIFFQLIPLLRLLVDKVSLASKRSAYLRAEMAGRRLCKLHRLSTNPSSLLIHISERAFFAAAIMYLVIVMLITFLEIKVINTLKPGEVSSLARQVPHLLVSKVVVLTLSEVPFFLLQFTRFEFGNIKDMASYEIETLDRIRILLTKNGKSNDEIERNIQTLKYHIKQATRPKNPFR